MCQGVENICVFGKHMRWVRIAYIYIYIYIHIYIFYEIVSRYIYVLLCNSIYTHIYVDIHVYNAYPTHVFSENASVFHNRHILWPGPHII